MKKTTGSAPDLQWFTQAKFGLFIHWGVYSVLERGEQVLFREHLCPSAYRQLAGRFRPRCFDAHDWARQAAAAGMRYALFTTKHHDGFCMWDTATTDFCAARTGLRRDYVKAYVEAFRAAGLRVGLYFSSADWSQPAYFAGPQADADAFRRFIDYTHEQVHELCTNYGKIDIFWFDGSWPHTAEEWRAAELLAHIRQWQPGIIINDRLALSGDIGTPEQSIPEQQHKPDRPWESCITSTQRYWGYHRGVGWKTSAETIRLLCQVVEVGGNLVYNVGPKPNGTFPLRFRHVLRDVGAWLRANGEAVYGTTETICDTTTFGLMTCGADRVYLHVLHWPGRELHLAGLLNRVLDVRFLATDAPITFYQDPEHLYLRDLPVRAPDAANTVIAVRVEGAPRAADWARERIWTGWTDPTLDRAKVVAARLVPWSRS